VAGGLLLGESAAEAEGDAEGDAAGDCRDAVLVEPQAARRTMATT